MNRSRIRRKREINRERLLALLIAAGLIAFGAAVALAGRSIITRLNADNEDRTAAISVTSEQERLDGIRKSFESGKGTLETLRSYYPDSLVLYKNGCYQFADRDGSLKQHSFDSSKVRKNSDGTWGYVDGDLKAVKGIDVSSHQGEIDWAKVAATNVDFAMIRAVYRGYESGKLLEDKMFRTNLEEAQANGIKTGVYIFTQAINTKEVDEEINMLTGLLGAYELDYPVVIDVEDLAGSTERIEQLGKTELTKLVRYYCDKVKDAGFTPMLYYNIDGALNLLDLKEFEDVDKWFAVYDSDFYYPYAYQMWQYKDTGKIDGIDGYVDLDLYFPDL